MGIFDNNNPYPYLRHESSYIDTGFKKAFELGTKGAVAIGKAGFKAAAYIAPYAGKAAIGTVSAIGSAGLKGAQWIGESAIDSLKSNNPVLNPVRTIGEAGIGLAQKMVKFRPAETIYNTTTKELEQRSPSLKLTKFGAGVILGGAAISSAIHAVDKFKERAMGKIDSKVTTSTPDYSPQEYSTSNDLIDPAGATGDLVFALFKNRHGGSML